MARILITGSTDGIGQSAARILIAQGHTVYLHARSPSRAESTKSSLPGAAGVLVADISTLSGMRSLAKSFNEEVSSTGKFDTVIHNAGIGYNSSHAMTEDGFMNLFAINSLAPYVLTCLMDRPKRLIYISSGLAGGGDKSLKDLAWRERKFNAMTAYSDSKYHDSLLAFAAGRKWKDVKVESVDPGWVKSKLGSYGAPGSTESGADTMAWLAGAGDEGSKAGEARHWKSRRVSGAPPGVEDVARQQEFLRICEGLSGVGFPE